MLAGAQLSGSNVVTFHTTSCLNIYFAKMQPTLKKSTNNTPLITIIDIGATHSFISLDCVKRLNLETSVMSSRMVIDTPANGSVTTKLVCVNCPVTVYGRSFGMDLVCIPLSELDVILGMNWLRFNRVHINCYVKTVISKTGRESEFAAYD
jgi:hypothetical protein